MTICIRTSSKQYDSLITIICGLIIVLKSIESIIFVYWPFNKNLKKYNLKIMKKTLINLTKMIIAFLIINGILFSIFNSFKT